jgi:peptide/nickel transport system substrate-binding protein
MAKIGIQVQVNAVDITKYLGDIYGPTKDYGIIYGYISCIGPDPSGCIDYTLGSQQLSQINTAQWAPPDIDELMKQGVATLNKARRFAIYSKMLQRIAQDVPYVATVLPVYSIMIGNKYTFPGLNRVQTDIIFNTPWILNLRPK